MLFAIGAMPALVCARTRGMGQVVDCAMTDGSALITSMIWEMVAEGSWKDERGVNLLDTGAPFYGTYEASDRKHLAIAPLEPQFFVSVEGVRRERVGLHLFGRGQRESIGPLRASKRDYDIGLSNLI